MTTSYYATEDVVGKSKKELIKMTGVASMKVAVARNTVAEDVKTNSIARDIVKLENLHKLNPESFAASFARLPTQDSNTTRPSSSPTNSMFDQTVRKSISLGSQMPNMRQSMPNLRSSWSKSNWRSKEDNYSFS